jgi:hypothetical protein
MTMTDYEQARMRFDILLAAQDYAAQRNGGGNAAPIGDIIQAAERFYEFVSNEAQAKKVFYVDVANLSKEQAEQYIEKCMRTKLETT